MPELEPEDAERPAKELVIAPLVHHRQRRGGVEVVLERRRELIPDPRGCGLVRAAEDVTKALRTGRRLGHDFVVEVDGFAPEAGQMEDQQRLAAPDVEDVAERDDVAERLRHLRRVQLEHSVVHPDPEQTGGRDSSIAQARSRDAEAQVASSAVDLEFVARNFSAMAEHSMCQPGRPGPTEIPRTRPRAASETSRGRSRADRASARSPPGRSSPRPRSRQPSVVGKARFEVDVPVGDVREILVHEQLDEADDLLDRLRRARFDVGPSEPRSSVSSKNHAVARSDSSRLGIPCFPASAYTLSSTSVML